MYDAITTIETPSWELGPVRADITRKTPLTSLQGTPPRDKNSMSEAELQAEVEAQRVKAKEAERELQELQL